MKKSWSTESFELSTDTDQFRMTDRRSAAFERRPQPKTAIELGASAPKLLRTARKVTLLVVQRHRENQSGSNFDAEVAHLHFVGVESRRDDSVFSDRISSLCLCVSVFSLFAFPNWVTSKARTQPSFSLLFIRKIRRIRGSNSGYKE